MMGRAGGGLILAGAATAVAAWLGGSIEIGARDLSGFLSLVAMALLGTGAVALASADVPPFTGRATRVGFGLLAVGLLGLVGSTVRAYSLTTDPLGDLLAVGLLFVGMIGTSIGMLAVSISLSRGVGAARVVGGILLAAIALEALASLVPALREAGAAVVGTILVLVGILGVGWLAFAPGTASAPGVAAEAPAGR